jgi:hypothetical protein
MVVDIIYIMQGFRSGNDGLEIEHLRHMETEIFNTIQNETISEQGIGE